MQTRRLVAAGVIVLIVIVIAVLLAGSGGDSGALKSYNASVYQLIAESTSNAKNALGKNGLESGNLTGTATGQTLATAEQTARAEVSKVRALHAPSQMAQAQAALVTVMQLRQQGLLLIANNAQQAASKLTSKDAVYKISLGTSQLYTSDVIYKTIVTQDIAQALNAAGVPTQQINGAQVIDDLGWLQQTWIASRIGAQLTTAEANVNNSQPNLGHGHQLDYVTVGGITLDPTGITTVPAASAQTWTLHLHNSGQTNENQVVCKLTIHGVTSQTATIPQTTPGEVTTCTVTLPTQPPKGPYSVTATIEKVPFENDLQNNTHTYTVTFN